MFNSPELYELSFVAPIRKRRTGPQLVFTLKEKNLGEITERLQRLSTRYEEHARTYSPEHAHFYPLSHDLFGRIEFGYGRCGLAAIKDGEVRLRVELRGGEGIYASTLTIHLLTWALGLPIEEPHQSNQSQQIEIHTRCEHVYVYGHAMGGHVSSRLRHWLRKEAVRALEQGSATVNPSVIQAMWVTWKAVSGGSRMPKKREFYGSVHSDGRFMLSCPGNACDLAIYPDHIFYGDEESDRSVQFSCHNLDYAHQQLTLLAGLAKLCELARKEEN